MKQRTITAVFFAAIMIGGIYWNRTSFQVLFTVIAAGMLWEFFGLVFPQDEPKRLFRRILGLILGFLPVWLMGIKIMWAASCGHSTEEEIWDNYWWSQRMSAVTLFTYVALAILPLLLLELFLDSKAPAESVGKYLVGLFYISVPIIILFPFVTPGLAFTPNRIFGLLLLIWTNDVFAYLIGSRFGKTKLFERISPKKTWEGTIGGGICTLAIAWGLSHWIDDYNQAQWLALGCVVALLATPGDLIESMLKRSAGVKDSGSLMPGHGGLLDRFDSFIFVLPFAWLAVILLGG